MAGILIVGAGPTGLTLAATLARYGHRPRLIDRAVVPPDDRSRAIVLQARTLELFEDLSIVDEVLSTGLTVDRGNIFTRRGGRGVLRFRPEWIESRYGRLVTLPQEETERILTAHVARAGITIEHGVELLSVAQDAAGADATLRGPDGRTEVARFDWIAGCDGAHSTLRHAVGLSFPGVTYANECLLGDVDLDWAAPDHEVSICPVPDGVLLAFPLPGTHRFRIIMILPAHAAPEDRHLSADEFLAQLTRMAPPRADGAPAPPRILTSRWLTRYRLHRRGVTAYRSGRCFVAGDAAHIHSPAGAQGMNTGIQDAWNLGWKLGLVARGDAPAWVLDTYHDERHRIGQFLLRDTDRMFAALAGGGWVGRAMRRFVPSLAVGLAGAPIVGRRITRFVSQTGIRYRASGLSTEGWDASRLGRRAPRAGDRAPDVELDGARWLAPLWHVARYSVLFFAGESAALADRMADHARVVTAAYGDTVHCHTLVTGAAPSATAVPDARGAAHARYGAGPEGAIYLVRPDGYLAWRDAGASLEALMATLRGRLTVRTPGTVRS